MSHPKIIPQKVHNIQESQVDKRVIGILEKLQRADFQAYIVGGGVRDLLLGFKPKDFDIVTDATPDQIRALFKNSRIIGRRFRLVHVHYGRDIVEVATFRAAPPAQNAAQNLDSFDHMAIDGQIIRDNIYGTIDEDVWRRDFTINALYYDAIAGDIIDYCDGFLHIKNHTIKILGHPETRYREDPVRMLRALRFAAKLSFTIEPATLTPINNNDYQELLSNIPPARLFEEYMKLFLTGHSEQSFLILNKYKILQKLFPFTAIKKIQDHYPQHLLFVHRVLQSTDQRLQNDLPVNPAFLLAAFLWHPLQLLYLESQNTSSNQNHGREHIWRLHTHKILKEQNVRLAIPKRFTQVMEEIWYLQRLLNKTRKKAVLKAAFHPKFRAGFDFLVLRSELEQTNSKQLQWWKDYEAADSQMRKNMLDHYAE